MPGIPLTSSAIVTQEGRRSWASRLASEIGDRPFVDPFVEIAVAAVEGDVAVVVIEHRRDAVEAEPVETVLFEPVFDVRQQEMFDLRFSVVEEFRVPVRLVAGGPAGE